MLHRIEDFENRTPSNIEYEFYSKEGKDPIKIYTIKTVHDLIQFIGYGKYMNGTEYKVYLRGQSSFHNGMMIPSLYRKRTKPESINSQYNEKINALKRSIKKFQKYDRKVLEPLLQHYGIKTPYIDLVDNVWVALWFALHKADSKVINSHEYVYYYENDEEFSYIFLLATDALSSTNQKGVYEGEKTTLVDLRSALPSYFLRPHAQHAYMLRKTIPCPTDYSDLIVGIAKIPTELGKKWIGVNEFLTVSTLFPAAYFDSGYATLLKVFPESDSSIVKQYGSIQILTD